MAGAEESFVSCIYALPERLPHTRFIVTAAPFIQRLKADAEYLESLRNMWKSRTIDPKKLPKNEVFFNVEAPRGELFYYCKGNETNMPARMKVRTPTLATLRAVPLALTGTEVQNVALIVISIDPCICCTER